MLPALLSSIALLAALFIQATNSVLAGAWLMFHLMGCGILLYRNHYPRTHSPLWWATLGWLAILCVSGFLISPVLNGVYWIAVLTAMPLLAISLSERDLKPYIKCFGAVLTLYAIGLVAQKIVLGGRVGWPLLDPNNAACMMQFALIPCLYMAVFKKADAWGWSVMLFAFALYATGSKTGIAAAGISLLVMLSCQYGAVAWGIALLAGMSGVTAAFFYRPERVVDCYHNLQDRFMLWNEGWQLWKLHPWKGIGLGQLKFYAVPYEGTMRLPPDFLHNDTIQFAVEMGTPVALVFVLLVICAARAAHRGNLVTSCTLLAVFIQSCMEFQFYLPSVTLCAGLALSWHMLNGRAGAFDK